jgi:hypothetical protein
MLVIHALFRGIFNLCRHSKFAAKLVLTAELWKIQNLYIFMVNL